MRNLILFFTIIAASVTIVSCDKDTPVAEAEPMNSAEVIILFSPQQLGDLGYSDKIFRGIKEYETSQANSAPNGADIGYISCDTDSATLNRLKKWAATPHNPLNSNQAYSRRLLVFTAQWQLNMLDSIQLGEGDEVLILDTKTDITDSLSTTRFGNRIHALNISAASAIVKFITLIQQYGAFGDNDKDCSLVYYPTLNYSAHTDSIHEVLSARKQDNIIVLEESLNQINVNPNSSFVKYLNSLSFAMAQDYYTKEAYDQYNRYAIVNYRSANQGFAFYLIKDYANPYNTLFIDGTENNYNLTKTYYVSRDFGKAIKEWMSQWLQSSAGSMPRIQWHGEWDGYCNNNIERYVEW